MFSKFLVSTVLLKKAVLNMLSANKSWYIHKSFRSDQRAKQVVSNSSGLVDFLIGVVNSVLNLPNRQMNFFGEIHIMEKQQSILPVKFFGGGGLSNKNYSWAGTC